MSIGMLEMRENSLFDDALAQYPDASDRLVMEAVRAWFRPRCDSMRGRPCWRDVLGEIGLSRDALHFFDMLMSALAQSAGRPLDIRCRCSQEVAGDEACLLQMIAFFQSNEQAAAHALSKERFAASTDHRLADITQWFAMTLLDTGVVVSKRARRVTFFH